MKIDRVFIDSGEATPATSLYLALAASDCYWDSIVRDDSTVSFFIFNPTELNDHLDESSNSLGVGEMLNRHAWLPTLIRRAVDNNALWPLLILSYWNWAPLVKACPKVRELR